MIQEESCNRFTDLKGDSRTKKEVMVMVAQEDSWAKAGGTINK